MSAENFAEQGGGRRKAGALQGQQRSYAEFTAIDVKGFYWILVLSLHYSPIKTAGSFEKEPAV